MKSLPDNWQMKSLSEIISLSKGKKPISLFNKKTQGSNRFIQIDDLRNDNNIKYTNDRVGVQVNERDILVAWDGANAGTIGYGLRGYIGSTLARLEICRNDISAQYLGAFLRTKSKELRINCTGATIPHLSKPFLLGIPIPLPPLPVQKQIAGILERADKARQKRKEANKLSNEFLQSVFLDMFGDPVSNPKGWDIALLKDIGKLNRGKSKHRPRNAPFLLGGPYPLVQTGDIVNSAVYIKSYHQTYSKAGLKQSKLWPNRTLCITIAANIGFTAILKFDACFPDSVVGFIPSTKVINEFLHFYFRSIQKSLEAGAPQSAQKNINLEVLSKLRVPLPPRQYQDRFALIVQKTEILKAKQQASETETDELFNSLMQKAFTGELVA